MKKILVQLTKNHINIFLKNVCSRRTNLGLLHYSRERILCNGGMEYYD